MESPSNTKHRKKSFKNEFDANENSESEEEEVPLTVRMMNIARMFTPVYL